MKKLKFEEFIENKKGIRRILLFYVAILYLAGYIFMLICNPYEAVRNIQLIFIIVITYYFGTRLIENFKKRG